MTQHAARAGGPGRPGRGVPAGPDAAPAGRGGRDLPGGRGQHLVHRALADAGRRRAGPRDWAPRSCRWRSGARSGSSPRTGPSTCAAGGPSRCSSARPCTSTPATDLRRGTELLGATRAGPARRPAGAGRCTSRRPGEPRTVAPRPPRGRAPRPSGPPGPRSRCRAARCRRPGGRSTCRGPASSAGSGRGARAPAGRGSRSGGAPARRTPGMSAVSVVIGSTSTLRRRLTGVAASSRRTPTAAAGDQPGTP